MGRLVDVALRRGMTAGVFVTLAALWPSVTLASAPCSRADEACSTKEVDSTAQERDGTRSNSLLQMTSVRGLLRTKDAEDEEEDAVETNVASLDGPCSGGPCAVLDSDMQSRSASSTWGSHLQKAQANVVDGTSHTSLRSFVAYASYLRRAVDALDLSRNASNAELDALVDQFIAAHTASTDHCPAELMEAKHQLNDLHQRIVDLANMVKAIEQEIQEAEQKRNKANDDLKKKKEQYDEDKSKIEDAKEEARKFLATLRLEMAEMRKIAQPSVTMNISNSAAGVTSGVVSLLEAPPVSDEKSTQDMVMKTKAASTELLSCLEEETAAMPENKNRASLVQIHRDVVELRRLAAERAIKGQLAATNCSVNQTTPVTVGNLTASLRSPADIANETYRSYHCSHIDSSYGGTIWLHCVNGVLSADSRGCIKFPNDAQCEAQRKNLQDTYVKAYVGLARLIDQYEKKVADTSPDENAKKKYEDGTDPKKKEAEDLADKIAEKTKQLQDLRSRLDDAWKAEKKLKDHITQLGQECKLLGNTTQYLADVRNAIHALEACPGIQRAEFHIPLYADMATFTLDPTKTDEQNDAAMDIACQAKAGAGTRAAEVSEIEGHSIEAAPMNNTAVVPLVGACPNCEGGLNADTGGTSVTGHGRICWDQGKPLDLKSRKIDCYQNLKAIMCVNDRGDVRKLAGFVNTTHPGH